MESKCQRRKKTTIFRMFLIPLTAIMLIQSVVTIGTLVAKRIAGTLQEYSGSMMSRLAENRKVILQNDMNQRWASVNEQELAMTEALQQFLDEEDMELLEFLDSSEQKTRFMELVFPD